MKKDKLLKLKHLLCCQEARKARLKAKQAEIDALQNSIESATPEKERWVRLNARLSGVPYTTSATLAKREPKRLRMKYSTWIREKKVLENRKEWLKRMGDSLPENILSREKNAIDRREKRLAEADVIMKGNW